MWANVVPVAHLQQGADVATSWLRSSFSLLGCQATNLSAMLSTSVTAAASTGTKAASQLGTVVKDVAKQGAEATRRASVRVGAGLSDAATVTGKVVGDVATVAGQAMKAGMERVEQVTVVAVDATQVCGAVWCRVAVP